MVGQMKHKVALLALVAIAVLLSLPRVGSAQSQGRMYVLESTIGSIKVGQEYALTDTITIPSGASIRAVMPSGKTQTIRGPFSGPVTDLAKGQKLNERVFAWVKNFFETGGAKEKTPGATRGMRTGSPHEIFSWTAVPASMDSTMCVAPGMRLQLVREPAPAAQRVTVVDIDMARKGEARWPSGSSATAWPASVDVRADGAYTLLVPDQPARQLTLRVLQQVPDDDDVLNELAARGCRHQFDAWMRKLATGKAP
jgi:hypothetical protein